MSAVSPARVYSRAGDTSFSRSYFESPQPAGRKITTGFTYLQRIGKSGSYDVWFPEELKRELDARLAKGLSIGAEQFPAQWAAVRQFELLQEAGNYKIYDLDCEIMQRAITDLTRSMRSGGYRITVATIGRYEETSQGDELEILDRRLQEGIAQMIHMLYMEEESGAANAENDARLAAGQWDYRQELPHIGVVLGACDMFRPEKSRTRKHKMARQFFDILSRLPQNHIVHDTAVGLQLPELIGENQWLYIADPEETFAAFNRLFVDLFDKFDGVSLSHLQGCGDGHEEVKATSLFMRGYGDRLNESSDRFYRNASLALN
ncbi:MAG: hypothetical protein WC464_02380 [Bdellovibrionales bacterium]